jgi:type IV pilus assembly protein PilC
MAVFIWEAKTRIGETRSGEMEADSSALVTQRLRAQQLQVVKVRKKPTEIIIRMPGSTGVEPKDLMVFTRQFATMIDAGLPMVQCLDILGNQMENPDFKKIVLNVKQSVESGSTLADALRKHPKVFNRLFVNLVEAGETGGILDTILNRLAEYIEKNAKLVKQVKGAMIYPSLVLGVSLLVTLVLLLKVIPVFQNMFEDFGQALPGMTQVVVDMSEWTRDNVSLIFLVISGTVAGSYAFLKSKQGRRLFDEFALTAPIFGPLVKKVSVAKFTRTMGTMLASGVPILEALDIVAGTAGNVVIEDGLQTVRSRISEGKAMAQSLGEMKVFPTMVVQMIAVGESTGAMDTMLNKIADFYDDEVDDAIGTMMSLLEPAIMAFLAVLLGGLVISMYLPVFSMAGSIGS